jgi:hypothetical protein
MEIVLGWSKKIAAECGEMSGGRKPPWEECLDPAKATGNPMLSV